MDVFRCLIVGKNGIASFKLGTLVAGRIRKKYRYDADGVFLTKIFYGLFTVPTLMYPRGSFNPVLWKGVVTPSVDGKQYTEDEFSDIVEGLALSLFEVFRTKSSMKENIMLYLMLGLAAMFVLFFMGGV